MEREKKEDHFMNKNLSKFIYRSLKMFHEIQTKKCVFLNRGLGIEFLLLRFFC